MYNQNRSEWARGREYKLWHVKHVIRNWSNWIRKICQRAAACIKKDLFVWASEWVSRECFYLCMRDRERWKPRCSNGKWIEGVKGEWRFGVHAVGEWTHFTLNQATFATFWRHTLAVLRLARINAYLYRMTCILSRQKNTRFGTHRINRLWHGSPQRTIQFFGNFTGSKMNCFLSHELRTISLIAYLKHVNSS